MDRVGEIDFVVCDDTPTLVWLAQMGALELHPSLSKVDAMECPTVDRVRPRPGPARRDARVLHGRTCGCASCSSGFGLESFAKTSGSKGIQVYVPLNGEETYDTDEAVRARGGAGAREGRARSRRLADDEVAADRQGARRLEPEHALEDDRRGLFAPRPRAADVSTPVTWDEVEAGAAGDDELGLRSRGRPGADRGARRPVRARCSSSNRSLPDGA